MNQSRLLERRILISLITDNPRGKVTQACYRFYRGLFIELFSGIKTMDEEQAGDLYAKTFAALCVELEENQGNQLGNGTLFSGLLLLGRERLGRSQPDLYLGRVRSNQPYIDSDMLLHLLKAEDPLIIDEVQKAFREPAGVMFCNQCGIEINHREVLEDILEPYNEAWGSLFQNIREGTVRPPMMATLFTYFYRIFKNKALDDYKKKGKWKNIIFDGETESFSPPEEPDDAYINQLITRLRKRLGPAEDAKELVVRLFDKAEEICRKLLKGFYLEEYSLKELGEMLELDHPKVRLHRCREKLRGLLN